VADESSIAVGVPVAVSLAFSKVLASVNFVTEEPSLPMGLFYAVVPIFSSFAIASGNLSPSVSLHASESLLAIGVFVTVSFTQLEAVLARSVDAVAIECGLNAVVPVVSTSAKASGNLCKSVSLVADEALLAVEGPVTVSLASLEAMLAGSMDAVSVKLVGFHTVIPGTFSLAFAAEDLFKSVSLLTDEASLAVRVAIAVSLTQAKLATVSL